MFFPRSNKVIEKYKQKEAALGMIVSSNSPDLMEIIGYAGCDYAMICMEHTCTSLESMENLIRVGENAGLTVFVRVPEVNELYIRHAREAGALGIVVPHVSTAEDVRRAQDFLRLPPEGHGGVCPGVRAARFDQETWEEYMRYSNENVSLFVLLEDSKALDNAEEIFAELRPGRDGFGVGNFDIAHESYTDANEKVQFSNPSVEKRKQEILKLGVERGIISQGIPWPTTDRAGVDNAMRSGVQALLFDIELKLFYTTVKNIVKACR